MPLTNDFLTVWELAHRLANKRPNLLSSIFIPTDVKENLRLLINEILQSNLFSTLIMEKWNPNSDFEPHFHIRYHLADIHNCINGDKYKKSLMEFVNIDKISFEDWCKKSGHPLPDFWFSIGYEPGDSYEASSYITDQEAKKNGQSGGHARAIKYKPLKKKIFEIYDKKYSSLENIDAARRILKELTSDDLSVLTTGDPEKRIATWIAEYKKLKK